MLGMRCLFLPVCVKKKSFSTHSLTNALVKEKVKSQSAQANICIFQSVSKLSMSLQSSLVDVFRHKTEL